MESNKALTITLITIACLATVLALLWILRGWIMKLWDKMCECFRGEKEENVMVDVEKMRQVVVEKPAMEVSLKMEEEIEREIHSPTVVEQPPYIFVAEASSTNTISPQVANILLEHEKRVKDGLKKIDEDYKKAKKEIDEKYDPEIAQINQNLDRIHEELKDRVSAVLVSIRIENTRERGTSLSSSESGIGE